MWTNVKPQVSCFQACPQRRFNRIGLNGVTRSHSLVFAVGLLSSIREWFGNLQTCSTGIIANMQKPLGEFDQIQNASDDRRFNSSLFVIRKSSSYFVLML